MYKLAHIAIIGNVSVGKTSIFRTLCRNGTHPVIIPPRMIEVQRGVVAIGPQAASRAVRRRCAACKSGMMANESGRHSMQTARPLAHDIRRCPVKEAVGNADPRDSAGELLVHLYDTPGSTTLAANDEDEMVALDLMLTGEMTGVIVVADAKNLRRSLALVLEAAEFGLPMVVSLNMIDEAEGMGVEVDDAGLTRELGLPLVRTVAVENNGIRRLAELLPQAMVASRRARFPEPVEKTIARLETCLANPYVTSRSIAVLLLSEDIAAVAWIRAHLGDAVLAEALEEVDTLQRGYGIPLRELIREAYFAEAERIVDRTVISSARGPGLLLRFGRLAQHPIYGSLIALLVLTFTYYFVGVFGATFVVSSLSTHLFGGLLMPLSDAAMAHVPSAFVRDAVMDPDFGLLPTGLFLALGIVLPVLFCFFLLQAVLEDSGYLPRLAVILDRLFRRLGLSGQSLIPLILGFSCITMAVITTRILPSKKERIIMTMLLILGIPCAPLLAVMLVVLGSMSWTAGVSIFGFIGLQILLAGYLASRIIPGELPDLILEIPTMRIPRPRIVLQKTWRRTWQFMKEAVPVFLIASFAVFVFNRLGGLVVIEHLFHPFIRGVLGLPDEFVQVLIKTAIRRESGATELMHVRARFDNVQLVVTMLVMTLLMPCINATIVIFKERGIKAASLILGSVSVWALVAGAAFNFVCRAIGVTFT